MKDPIEQVAHMLRLADETQAEVSRARDAARVAMARLLRIHMDRLGMTQLEVCAALGTNRGTLCAMLYAENAKRYSAMPSPWTVLQYVQTLSQMES